MGIEEKTTELEVKLKKEITNLKSQVATLSSQLQQLTGKVSTPSTTARLRAGIGPMKSETGLTLKTTEYVEILVDGVLRKVGLVE